MKYKNPSDLPLLEALEKIFPDSSKTTLRSWIKEGRIQVNGTVCKTSNAMIFKNSEIELNARPRLVESNFPIIYEDKHLIVIDKPEGLLSVSTAFETKETAFAYLKRKYHPRPVYVVHRLDQETSGVMLFAFTQKAQEALKATFEKHDLQRQYVAIVEGKMEVRSGTWKSNLVEDARYFVSSTDDPDQGELAISHFLVKASTKFYSWLEVTLETGKKNQIRVHCKDAGNPVVGDKKYGTGKSPIKRLCLHAHLLAFNHPVTGKAMRFESQVPETFYRLLRPK